MHTGTVLKVVKSLYGIPESGLHWYMTNLEHHLILLGMRRSAVDPCVLYKGAGENLEGAIVLQVDDYFCFGPGKVLNDQGRSKEYLNLKKALQITSYTSPYFNCL